MNVDKRPILTRMHVEIDLREIESLIQTRRSMFYASELSQKRAIYSAVIVLLCARLEAYVEDVFSFTLSQLRFYKQKTIGESEELEQVEQFRNPSTKNINRFFQAVGIQNILDKVHIDRMKKTQVYKAINQIVELRHKIAHGKTCSVNTNYPVNLTDCIRFYKFVRRFFISFESEVNRNLGPRLAEAKRNSPLRWDYAGPKVSYVSILQSTKCPVLDFAVFCLPESRASLFTELVSSK